jgi:CSLREA domain-containing protein
MSRLLIIRLAGIFAALCFALPVSASTFFVDTTADAVDAVPGDGVCAASSGACTLRAAIQ